MAWKLDIFRVYQARVGREPRKDAKPTTKPNTQKKGSRPPKSSRGPPEAPRRHPGGPPEAPRRPAGGLRGAPKPASPRKRARGPPKVPGRFRSSETHDRKSPQPFRKIPKAYRSARDKTLDQSQADKGGSGNLGRQPETRKGIKLGGCLRKQGVGKRNQHTSSWFVAHERCAVA